MVGSRMKSGREFQTVEPATEAEVIGWSLTALSTQFRSYRAFKVTLYYKY